MEKSNEVSSPETNVPETIPAQTNMSQQQVEGNNEQPLTEPIPQKNKKWVIPTLVVGLVLSIGVAGFFAYQNFQMTRNMAEQIQPTVAPNIPSPTTSAPTTEPSTETPQDNSFNYNNFTISYPDNWTFLDMSVDSDFPLKDRLSPLYSSDKVVALEKSGVYLIITIEPESEGGAGGIFVDDLQYNEFIADKDKVTIGGSTYYLSKSHYGIPGLLESHAGPYGWSVLAEYIPSKPTQSGTVFKGYENVIKKNGFAYNFIVASNQDGNTNSQLQQEIIDILESIKW